KDLNMEFNPSDHPRASTIFLSKSQTDDAEPEVLPKPVVEMSTRQGRLQAVLQATEPGVKAAASPLCLLVSLSDALGEFFHEKPSVSPGPQTATQQSCDQCLPSHLFPRYP
ncbi:Cyclin-Y, partial [Pteropus alecto]